MKAHTQSQQIRKKLEIKTDCIRIKEVTNIYNIKSWYSEVTYLHNIFG